MDDNSADRNSIGYLSDGLIVRAQDRKKGVPWTEEEHRTFLIGLEKLGKGDWRGISRNYVTTRTPTQVASHAQKYFIRLASINKKKRRSSLFDLVVKSSKCDDQVEKDATLSLLGCLTSFQQQEVTKSNEQKITSADINYHNSQAQYSSAAEHQSVPIWLHPSKNKSSNVTPNASVVPDLELTLAVPKAKSTLQQEQAKSSPGSFLLGPISVT
ncbi:SANT/Myb domain [Sesbania bispinosa]|nr:SANT/Myb domain [Sesbania bispinosa]